MCQAVTSPVLRKSVLFIFPVWTSFSFYKVLKKTETDHQALDTSSHTRKKSIESGGDDSLTARYQRRPNLAYRMPYHLKEKQNEVMKEKEVGSGKVFKFLLIILFTSLLQG